MNRFQTIIFLDEEGTDLSPYAEILMRSKMKTRKREGFQILSRGSVVLFPEPANQKITELACLQGLSLEGYRAMALEGNEFSERTLILAFTASCKQKVYERFPNASNVYTIREFVGEQGDIRLPLGGSLEEYDNVCKVVDRVLDSLLEKLTEE